MTTAERKAIEESNQFKLFLIRFGVKWFAEYLKLEEHEQGICRDVFLSLYPKFLENGKVDENSNGA